MPAILSPIELFIRRAQQAGCPIDQTVNFLKAGIVLHPKQLAFAAACRQCDRPDGPTEVLFGGSRGPGKSFAMLAQVGVDDCQRFAGLKCLLLRKVAKSAKEGFEDLIPAVLGGVPHRYRPSAGTLDFGNGSRVLLGGFRDEGDVDKYLGLEYDVIAVEEATTLTVTKLRMIGTCNRTSKPGWRPRRYYSTNPGGISHGHFKQTFILPYRNEHETATRFIPATARDNPAVNPDYLRILEGLVGWQRQAWLEGSWDIAAGQFFINWRDDVHVVEPFAEIPRHWRVWLGFDYGFTHYTSVHLLAQDGDGNVYVCAEHAERGRLPARHAKSILDMLAAKGVEPYRVEVILAGHDVFNRDRDGGCVADDYEREGLTLTRADIDRVPRAAEMLRRLGDPANGQRPSLFVARDCTRLIECIPNLQHNPNRPEDVLKVDVDPESGDGGDDPYDSASYGLMHVALPPVLGGVAGGERSKIDTR
jgi:hypothetical protein